MRKWRIFVTWHALSGWPVEGCDVGDELNVSGRGMIALDDDEVCVSCDGDGNRDDASNNDCSNGANVDCDIASRVLLSNERLNPRRASIMDLQTQRV